MRTAVLGLALALAPAAAGCGVQIREAHAHEPNPRLSLGSSSTLPASTKLYVYQRDNNFERPRDYQLRNWAQFTVVSPDRVRFHVGVVKMEEEEAETSRWKVWLEDDAGHRWQPVEREMPRVTRVQISWGLFPYDPNNTSWCKQPPCLSRIMPGYTAYVGQAEYMFKDPSILAPDRKQVSLVVQHGSVAYKYTWTFGEGQEVQHYGRTHVDDEMGIIAVPGPHTEVADSHYEEESW